MDERQQKLKEIESWDAQDRISNLPDVLLTHILSFVPTKDAVRTSVLSTRWKPLWACVPVLDLRDSEFSPKGDALMDRSKRKANFLTFVYRFLMQNNWSSIRKFCLICSECYDLSQIESWLCALKSPNLEDLQLAIYAFLAPTGDLPSQTKRSCLSLSFNCLDPHLSQKTSLPTGKFSIEGSYLEDPCILDSLFSLPKEWNVRELEFEGCSEGFNWHKTYNFPQRLFTCEALVVLKLLQCVDLDCPEDMICFPNIKVLHLVDNTFKYHDSASKLINCSCPVLEELYIKRGEWDDLQLLVITSDTLKRLEVSYWCYDGDDLPFETLIDVPAVEYLDLQDWVSKKYVLGDFGSVIEATIDLGTTSELLRKIHNVKELHLLDNVWVLEKSLDIRVFHYLTSLKFQYSWDERGTIMLTLILQFLHMSPILEDLHFQRVEFVLGEEFDLMSENDVPHCLSSTLKTCRFRFLNVEENEVKVIGYFLKNSKVLEQMSISSCDPNNVNKQAVSALSKGSSTCKINYERR